MRNQPTGAPQRELYRAPSGVYWAEFRDTRSSTLILKPGASGGTRTPVLAFLDYEATVVAVRRKSHLPVQLLPGIGRRHVHHRCREKQYCGFVKCTGEPHDSQSTPRAQHTLASALSSSFHPLLTVQGIDRSHSL